jgi:hypothetical protein
MYKTESTLGLVGNILGIIAIALILIVSLVIGALLNAATNALVQEGFEVSSDVTAAAGAGVAVIIIGLIISIASVVLGFMGTAKLKKDDKKGGIFLIIAGALALVSLFTAGWFGIVSMVLYFIGGIMAMTKKDTAVQP